MNKQSIFFCSLLRIPIWPLPFWVETQIQTLSLSLVFTQCGFSKASLNYLSFRDKVCYANFSVGEHTSWQFKYHKCSGMFDRAWTEKNNTFSFYWSDNSKSTGKWDCFLFLNAFNGNGSVVRLKIPIWHLSQHKCVCEKVFFFLATGCRCSDVSLFLYGDLWGQWKIAVGCEKLSYCKLNMVTVSFFFFFLFIEINFEWLFKGSWTFNANSFTIFPRTY